MTDKERLEEIKNSFLEGQHILFGTSWVSMPKESFDWLIKQVEKAERYKQALEFYANEETYETKFATDTNEICDLFTLIELDNGQKARQALEG